MDLDLAGKRVAVTGGSKGIGLETARRFTSEGAAVSICARGRAGLDEAGQSIGRGVDLFEADVTKPEDIRRYGAHLEEKFGGVDILVNNAGTGTYKPFLEVSDAELEYGMAINFFAQFRMCREVVPGMIARGKGAIVNVSGRTAIRTNFPPGSTCTGPAKAAENRFSADLANELLAHNIRVNCVIPGVIATPDRFGKWEREAMGNRAGPEQAERLRRDLEHGRGVQSGSRWGRPEEIADLIAFLASDRAGYINGAEIVADGGPNTKSYVGALYQAREADDRTR